MIAFVVDADGKVRNAAKARVSKETSTDIINTTVDENNGVSAQYYDLMGRRVMNPEHGIYVKVQNGKAAKIAL